MTQRRASVKRATKETDISVDLDLTAEAPIDIRIAGVPFMEHLLTAFAYHGGFSLAVRGTGDVEVDAHHLVEDVGLVLGSAFDKIVADFGHVRRFGHAVIPMDDALSEATVDAGGRPYLVFRADFPQPWVGTFDVDLLRQFFGALATAGRMNLHLACRYGDNSHHMAEALFKAAGKALRAAFESAGDKPLSTKGTIG